jgi:hypothetical protein
MFAPHPLNRFVALLEEALASVVELLTLGEVRLAGSRCAHDRRVRRGAAVACSNHAFATRLTAGGRRPGHVLMLWPELDQALEERGGRPRRRPRPRPRLEADRRPAAGARASSETAHIVSGGLAATRSAYPHRSGGIGAGRLSGQSRRSSSHASSRRRSTSLRSPSSDVATRCARSSLTPGRSSTSTS